ncbi:MAG: hypothetical protein KIS92_18980 [Planctomycetota bacterium]|nr:hypothetical protein [Planctomycetota bacterium]
MIVLSSEAKPYKDAQGTLLEKLERQGYKCTSVLQPDLSNEKLNQYLQAKPWAFVAIGSDAAVTLHEKIPARQKLLYCLVTDPSDLGLLKGRPAQGVTVDVPLREQFALIAEALPKAHSVGMLYDSSGEKGARLMQAAKNALPNGWSLDAVDLSKFDSVAKAIDELLRRRVDIVWTAPDSAVYNQASVRVLLREALREKIPVFGYSKSFVKAGALLGVAIEPESQGAQAAAMLERLENPQAKPAPLDPEKAHVEAPLFGVEVNEMAAQQLSINLPESVLKKSKGE